MQPGVSRSSQDSIKENVDLYGIDKINSEKVFFLLTLILLTLLFGGKISHLFIHSTCLLSTYYVAGNAGWIRQSPIFKKKWRIPICKDHGFSDANSVLKMGGVMES